MPRPSLLYCVSLLGLLLPVSAACRSSSANPKDSRKPEPFVPLPDEEPDSIGYFLTRFDLSLRQWSELKLGASSARQQSVLDALERSLEQRASDRKQELLQVFESGAPVNRRIAAAALGFTHDASVLSPLLTALSEPDPELVQKALLGIGVLQVASTPLAEIRRILLQDDDAWTRNNAAFVLLSLARVTSQPGELAETCRLGLIDSEPGVRAQCASTLGLLADDAAVPTLCGLLHDDTNLVVLASAAALYSIGKAHAQQKGTVARGLVDALDVVPADRRRHILKALCLLAEQDMGEDSRPWREWSQRMP